MTLSILDHASRGEKTRAHLHNSRVVFLLLHVPTSPSWSSTSCLTSMDTTLAHTHLPLLLYCFEYLTIQCRHSSAVFAHNESRSPLGNACNSCVHLETRLHQHSRYRHPSRLPTILITVADISILDVGSVRFTGQARRSVPTFPISLCLMAPSVQSR